MRNFWLHNVIRWEFRYFVNIAKIVAPVVHDHSVSEVEAWLPEKDALVCGEWLFWGNVDLAINRSYFSEIVIWIRMSDKSMRRKATLTDYYQPIRYRSVGVPHRRFLNGS